MEILNETKKDLQKLGLLQSNHSHGKFFNFARYSGIFFLLFVIFSTSLWFFFFEAKQFGEHIEAAMLAYSGFLNTVLLSIATRQRKTIIELIAEYESIIANRML